MMFIFSTLVLIRQLWQLKTVVFLRWCLKCAFLLEPVDGSSEKEGTFKILSFCEKRCLFHFATVSFMSAVARGKNHKFINQTCYLFEMVLWVFTETGFHRNGFSPNALRAGFQRMPFRYGVSLNFYSINIVHSVKPCPYGFSPNALKVWVFTEYP
jgi:hypothetical protein